MRDNETRLVDVVIFLVDYDDFASQARIRPVETAEVEEADRILPLDHERRRYDGDGSNDTRLTLFDVMRRQVANPRKDCVNMQFRDDVVNDFVAHLFDVFGVHVSYGLMDVRESER